MMVGVPESFASPMERATVNYNFFDLAAGSGIANYYGGIVSGATYILSSSKFYSDHVVITTGSIAAADTATAVLDIDFDVLMNLPTTLKGYMLVNIPMKIVAAADGYYRCQYVLAKLRKWDGSTETEIASSTTSTHIYENGVTGAATDLGAVGFTVPVTHFKRGEYLRISCVMYGWSELAGQGTTFIMGCDPMGRLGITSKDLAANFFVAGDSTLLTAQVPIRIDL